MAAVTSGPLIAVVGETASGKSRFAMHLATLYGGEIIAADAWTVYRGFTIGTAKPSLADMRAIEHHMVDVYDPNFRCTVAEYKHAALLAIDDCMSRGNVPILVGGTGLYIDSVLFDYQFRQNTDAVSREYLSLMTNEELRDEAARLSLGTDGIDIANNRRLIRHIESRGVVAEKRSLRRDTLVLGLSVHKDDLEKRIAERVNDMFAAGLENEVRNLSEEYGWDVAPMQAIGYREMKAYLDYSQDLEETKNLIARNTRRLAKKQRTWFRRNKSIHWVNNYQEAVELVTTFLNNYRR